MSLKNLCGIQSSLKNSWFPFFIIILFFLVGCGEVEEATTQEKPSQPNAPVAAVASNQGKTNEEKPMESVLRNFIGSDMDQLSESTPQPTANVSPNQLSQYEKQIEELRTENTGLKQKVVKFEEENRSINTRMAEVEAKYAAEKLRADKSDELTKAPQLPKVEEPVVTAPPVSGSAYDDALKAFKDRKYTDASKKFKTIINGSADASVKNLSKYWLGESYFAQKKYKEALPLFQETLKFKSSTKKSDAQFMIAQSYDKLGMKAKAKSAYEKVVKNYPMSKNVKRAKERWAKL